MNAKNQRQSDPFAALQRDINQLGMIHYNKAKKAKEKAKKQKLSRQAKIKKAERSKENSFINQQNQYPKLPSLYQNNNGVLRKLPQINNPLLQRINLELQNNIQKKQNQKLIQHVAGLRIKNKTSNSLYQQQIPPQYPQPFPYSPFMSPMVNPMLNPMMPMMNPYQMPFQQQTPINNQQSKTSYQKKKKFSPLSMFRIAGYVVFFSLFFKKFAKTFTIHRFDKFKQDWLGQQAIPRARQNLIEYFRQNIELQIFDRRQIKDLDSLHNIAEEKKKKKKKIKKKIMKNQKKQTESSQSSEDDDQSDQQEQKYSRTQNAKSNVFQFYLKIDIAVAFVIQFVKQINRILVNEDFQQNNPFLVLLLPRQFQPDYLHEQGDFKYLNIHPTKGYSQHEKIFSQYLLIKNIYLTIFVQKGLLNELAGKFYFKIKKGSKVKQNKVFFSFFIRSTILKTMIESYLAKKIKKLKQYNLPKLESRPFLKKNFEHQALKSQFVSLENEGIDMREQSIQQISKQQTKKREIQFRALLDEGCQILMNKVFALRKKLLNELKQQVFAQQQKYRVQKDNYFKLHERQDFARKIPTKQSISKSSVPISSSYGSIQSDKISINQRIKSNKYPLKANKQTLKSNTKNKTQKQQPKQTTKTLEQQQQQQQEQEEDSDDD